MNDIRRLPYEAYGRGFERDEIRDEQLLGFGHRPDEYRPLGAAEIAVLERNANASPDWGLVRVKDPFDPGLVRDSSFVGLVRIGTVSRVLLEHHDLRTPVG